MRYRDIARLLKPYSIVAKRTTTINHAFASAIAPCDSYDESRIRAAITLLGQDPDSDLACVYCDSRAETWDHVHATVRNKMFSGFGHRLGNLVPCCKACNSRKGNKVWSIFMDTLGLEAGVLARRKELIGAYLNKYRLVDSIPENLPEYQELQELRKQVIEIFSRADFLADQIRLRLT